MVTGIRLSQMSTGANRWGLLAEREQISGIPFPQANQSYLVLFEIARALENI